MTIHKKTPHKSGRSPSKGKSIAKHSAATQSGKKLAETTLRTNDVEAEQGRTVNDLVAAVPFNAIKESEYGHGNALSPCGGTSVEAASAVLTARPALKLMAQPRQGAGQSQA